MGKPDENSAKAIIRQNFSQTIQANQFYSLMINPNIAAIIQNVLFQ